MPTSRRSGRVRNLSWPAIIAEAKTIVESYDTKVTLRQLFYRLVAKMLIPNVLTKYKYLSAVTAAGRRDGSFPDLTDRGREIHGGGGWDNSPAEALRDAAEYYSRDHSEGQPWSIYVCVEKAGMIEQLTSWFGKYNIAVLALGGYASQSYVDEVRRNVERQGRPAVLLGATDHDPTGWDIWRDFLARTDCWEVAVRLALTPQQVQQYQLPESVEPEVVKKLENDSRAKAFVAPFGSLTQVELDALPPDVLRSLFEYAIFGDSVQPGGFWDTSRYEEVLAREAAERAELIAFADSYEAQS
jgi:hypothetical protein